MEFKADRLDSLPSIAKSIVKKAGNRRVILFDGKMGVGKTTLIKEICLKLGVEENISSPSFGIINEYEGKGCIVYHFDAYRLENEEEAYDIGIEDYLYSGHWCLIEWAEKIKNLLPSITEIMEVKIKDLQGKRIYTFK